MGRDRAGDPEHSAADARELVRRIPAQPRLGGPLGQAARRDVPAGSWCAGPRPRRPRPAGSRVFWGAVRSPRTDEEPGDAPGGPSERPLGLPSAATPDEADVACGHRGPGEATSPPVGDRWSVPAAGPIFPLAWQVLETDHFRVFHADPALARKAAEAAEAVRAEQTDKWGSPAREAGWSPRCDLYLYPTPQEFARMTGQPETSPGFSTMSINGDRVIARRVNLRADHPQLLTAILPHEVTHVVLADLFIQQQIPRWADEGMAVLAEPRTEQLGRASELAGPIREGRIFKLSRVDGHRLPERRGLEPLLRPERLPDAIPRESRHAPAIRQVRAIRPDQGGRSRLAGGLPDRRRRRPGAAMDPVRRATNRRDRIEPDAGNRHRRYADDPAIE